MTALDEAIRTNDKAALRRFSTKGNMSPKRRVRRRVAIRTPDVEDSFERILPPTEKEEQDRAEAANEHIIPLSVYD